TNWTLSTDASWIDLAFNSGSNNATVDFSFTENFSSDFRVDSIAVTALGLPPLYLVITQAGQEATLQVDPLLINLEAPAGNTSFQIIANTDWTVSTEAFWISLGTNSGTGNSEVGFAHTENVEPGSRTATIEVSAPGLPTQVITVIQASSQGILLVDTDTLFLPNSVGNATVNVTSNLDWSANSAAGWLGFIPENGSGNGTVTVMHAANSNLESRSTDIQFLADGAFPANVHVIQEGRPRFIDASTDTIFMNEAGGLAVFTIFSNVSWTAESSAGWLALAQTAGDGTVFIDLNVAPNGSPSERIATLDIQGEGTPPLTVVVVQEGDAPFLDLGTSSLLLSPSTADAEVQVLSNVNWTVTNSNDWLTPVNTSGTGDFALTLIHTANNAFTNRRDTLRFSAPGLPDVLLPVLQLGQTPDVPWVISPTSENHTIIIPPDFTGAISEQVSLEAGDAVGFFFTRPDGGLQSSNFFIYRPGETLSVAVYGDDSEDGEPKNGFSIGEVFKIKVFRQADQIEYDVVGEYAPVGTDNLITHRRMFAIDGISMLLSVESEGASFFGLQLSEGWNMISSFIDPDPANMLEILENVASQVVLIKDQTGATAVPNLGLNAIGDWNVMRGYQIKMLEETILDISGTPVQPALTPIELETGWQIIAYLLDGPRPVEGQFSGVVNQLDIVKDNEGNVYVPDYSINTLGDLEPGQGYKVRMLNPATLIYAENFTGSPPSTSPAMSTQFPLGDNFNTGQNATIIIPTQAIEGMLVPGDEIAVFNVMDSVAGSAVVEEGNIAITVWGDDPLTGGAPEGMTEDEPYRFRIWRMSENRIYDAVATYASGDGRYREDDIEIVMTLEIVTSIAEQPNFAPAKVYPNPLFGHLKISLDPSDPVLRILVSDASGRLLATIREEDIAPEIQFSTDNWPTGIINLEFIRPAGSRTRKVIKIKQP
ncbi:MAG: BACON domain-containing carbohydrate-binding protein, partial [Bacteroidota bacterium]